MGCVASATRYHIGQVAARVNPQLGKDQRRRTHRQTSADARTTIAVLREKCLNSAYMVQTRMEF